MNRGMGKFVILVLGIIHLAAGCGGGTSSVPITVSIQPLTATSIDEGQALIITAAVTNDNSNKGVTWSLSCAASSCGTISSQTPTTATYVAPTPVSANLTAKILATSAVDQSKSASSSITVVVPPSVTTTALPGATGGSAYNSAVQESGGIAPFVWSITAGSLPTGLGLNSDGTISGTPGAGGNFQFTVQVADSGAPPLTASASLTVNVVVLPLVITTTTLPNGTVDEPYKQLVQVTGGIPPYGWSIDDGTLASWASLNSSTGTINGIPNTTGTDNFTVKVTDSEPSALSSTQALSLTTVSATEANDSELSGLYAFLFSGFDDATGAPVAIAGSFTADGNGKITTGVEDENGPNGAALNVPLTGTYNIAPDHRGAITIITASGPKTYALALNSINNGTAGRGRFVEFDDTTGTSGQRGSGILRAQDATAFSLGGITGPYAFGVAGQDANGNREVIVGSFTANGTGTIPSGTADQNVAGTATNPSLTGSYTTPSNTNGRATLNLQPSGTLSLNMTAYVVSSNELLVLTTDPLSSSGLVSGVIQSQALITFDNSALSAPMVYYLLGVNPTASSTQSAAEIGRLQPDGSGNVAGEYDAQVGTGVTKNQSFTAAYSVLPTGRVIINGWHGPTTNSPQIFYLVDKNKAFFLDVGHTGLGFVEPQSAVPSGGFTSGALSGPYSAVTVAPSVSGELNGTGLATLDGMGTFSETANISALSGLFVDQTTSGTYDVAATGRGTVTSLSVTTATFSLSMLGLTAIAVILLGSRKPQRKTPRRGFAVFCCAALFATTPTSCRPPTTNQLVFYLISPTEAVMIHQQSSNSIPEITIIER